VRELAGPLPVEYVAELKLDGLSVALRYEPTLRRRSAADDRHHARRRPDRRGRHLEHPHHPQRAAHDLRRKTEKAPACRRDLKCAAKW
jgi:hypothetical protein